MEKIRCSPEQKTECKYKLGVLGCHTSVHHEYYPKRDYTTPTEKRFRELDENKTRMCRAMHDEIHATEEPPDKPSYLQMESAIADARRRDRVQADAQRIMELLTSQEAI